MTRAPFRSHIARFARQEDGSIAIELVIIVPALFWAYLAMFTTFDAYRAHSVNQKASYTISDMISRETTPIDNAYIQGLRSVQAHLMNKRSENVSIRVTSVSYDADADSYARAWSHGVGAYPALGDGDVAGWHDRMPVMADGEHLTVLETWVDYSPPFKTGLGDRVIQSFVFTKPRYADRVLWSGA